MHTEEPPQAALEEAVTRLLGLAFVEIRFFASAGHEDQSPEAVAQRREAARGIADLCHNLPGYLAPERRHALADGLRRNWETFGPGKRQWVRARFDEIGYDHGWLTDTEIR